MVTFSILGGNKLKLFYLFLTKEIKKKLVPEIYIKSQSYCFTDTLYFLTYLLSGSGDTCLTTVINEKHLSWSLVHSELSANYFITHLKNALHLKQ